MSRNEMLGVGIYTVPEAARLTGVSSQRIRRWLKGYTYRKGEELSSSSPIISPDIPAADGSVALSFRDLVEVRFIDAFLDHGVSWKALRRAASLASEILHSSHPFSTQKFKTDGRTIFADIAQASGERSLLDLIARQYNIHSFVSPRLFEGIEFGPHGEAHRWLPLWPSRKVVIDPRISFGQPAVAREGVPTHVLAGAAEAEGSAARVAKIYDVSPASVEAAIEYESWLAA